MCSNPVDEYVTERYLSSTNGAWRLVRASARQILLQKSSISEVGVCRDACRHKALQWLNEVAERDLEDGSLQLDSEDISARLIGYVAQLYPKFLMREVSGEQVLLRGAGLTLWHEYFASTSELYGPYNRIAANAVAEFMRDRNRTSIVELGAGSGGGSLEILRAAGKVGRSVAFLITDASASLLMRNKQRLSSELSETEFSIQHRCLNFDQPITIEGSCDLVVAVNALHNAQDVTTTLESIKNVLKPNGALILVESVCGQGQKVHQDLIFNMLPTVRRTQHAESRFYPSSFWRQSIYEAGLIGSMSINSLGPELVLLAVAGLA